jgi:hypothetical protein
MSRNVKPRCNIDNQVFGYLTVIGYAGQGKQFCKCECGSEVKIPTGSLKGGLRTSCGCRKYFREQSKECIKCDVILCDKNEYKSRTYSSGKKTKSNIVGLNLLFVIITMQIQRLKN